MADPHTGTETLSRLGSGGWLMKPSVELVSVAVELLALLVATSLLSTLGLYLELLAIGAITTGQITLGLWLCLCGGVALYFGVYAMGITELLPRVRRLTTP